MFKIENYTIQERFFVFLGLICLGTFYTNIYYHNKFDQDIQESLAFNNEITSTHVANSITKSMAIDHWKSMYLGQKELSIMLEKQIDVINDYWSKENTELKDQLFDLKNGAGSNGQKKE